MRCDQNHEDPPESIQNQCKPMQINGTDYLIDANRVVYTHNVDSPSIVGKLHDSGELILLTPTVQVNTIGE